ncbi:hypothetical protein M8J77_024713 [Diaphorina citri]|nr:hypothetical protein M8J77_024713 [Diaphorina citri]
MSNLHRVAIADIYLLSADEVRYEIWMRSGQSADLLDAHQARERLRTILAVEKIEPSMTSVAADVVIPDLQKEVQTIEQKIRKQREVVERFSDKSHSKGYRKCFAKLNHVWNRINIIPADNNQLRLDLHKEVMDLHWLLESKASVSGSDVEQSSGDEYVDAELPSVSTQRPPLPAITSSSPNTSHARADTLINEMENTVRRVSIVRDVQYNPGDLVMRLNFKLSSAANHYNANLDKKWLGPFVIGRRIGPVIYELLRQDNSDAGRWHVRHLKPFFER